MANSGILGQQRQSCLARCRVCHATATRIAKLIPRAIATKDLLAKLGAAHQVEISALKRSFTCSNEGLVMGHTSSADLAVPPERGHSSASALDEHQTQAEHPEDNNEVAVT